MKYAHKRALTLFFLCVSLGGWGVLTARADDAWLSKIALSELNRAAENGEFDELGKQVKGAIMGRLSTGKIKNFDVMTDLIYVLRACRYGQIAMELDLTKTSAKDGTFKDGKELFQWLVANRGLSRVLFRGMEDVSDPRKSLMAVVELKPVGNKTLLAYSELVTAFATSRSARCYHKQPAPASIRESFMYYTTRKMRYDLKTMPYELSRYLADTELSIKERNWAYGKYSRHPSPVQSYKALKYDSDHLRDGTPKKISKLEFTLPNLLKVGGVCIEQAYYSSEICKAVGIPAKIVTGRGASGISHAWTMCFVKTPRSHGAGWDSSTGRYGSQKYFVGNVQNPATGRGMFDIELMLEGAAALLKPTRREDADTATSLAILAADLANAGKLGDTTDLKAMAALYKKRFAKSPVDPETLNATVKIDMVMVEDFLSMALACNIAHRPVWDFILELRVNRDMLEVSHLRKFFDVLTSKTAKAYPDYSCDMVLRIVPSMSKHAARMNVYKNALRVYAARRDLQGRILLACGDDCAGNDKPALALKFYESAAMKNLDLAVVVTPASRKAEKLLVDAGKTKAAIAMYAKLFKATKKPRKVSENFTGQTTYNILGTRLADLLESIGDARNAQKTRAMLK
ncbi:MAG: hypothetical protein HN350_05940 [Phycisphaerales bacterium]|nr:hypothetical protein [Phycisphaerales bacterium]